VAEIAKMLNGKAVGLGSPIGERAAWAGIPGAADIVSYAAQSASAPAPETTDDLYLAFKKTEDRRGFEDVASRRRMRLTQFVLGECIEDKGRFLAPAEKEIAAILDERAWTLPAHDRDLKSFNGQPIADLAASQRGWILASADYLLGDKLRPETRGRIRAEVARRVFLPYKEAVMGTSLQGAPWIKDKAKTNWNAVCHAGIVGAALALGGKPVELAWYVSAAENFLPYYFDGFGKDGYCPEGLGYWNYGFGHFVMLAETVGRATSWQIDFYLLDKVEAILAYPDRIALFPGVYPAFSDMDPTVQPEPWIPALVRSRSDQKGSPCRLSRRRRQDAAGRQHPRLLCATSFPMRAFMFFAEKVPLRGRDSRWPSWSAITEHRTTTMTWVPMRSRATGALFWRIPERKFILREPSVRAAMKAGSSVPSATRCRRLMALCRTPARRPVARSPMPSFRRRRIPSSSISGRLT
jgi:hypothetical protein